MMKVAGIGLFIILIISSGCISYNSLINFSETNKNKLPERPISNFEPIKIQPNDVIKIILSSTEASALAPFVAGNAQEGTGSTTDDFLVSDDGFIEFPTIGKIKVGGKVVEEVKAAILEKLAPYFTTSPIIQVRLTNFRININGEVASPGSFLITSPRVSVFDAITLAGDFTDYSRRDSIMIIREINGTRSFGYVDFNSLDVFDSPYFYLKQNDMIYVQPSEAKVNLIRDSASKALPYISGVVSVVAIIVTIYSVLINRK